MDNNDFDDKYEMATTHGDTQWDFGYGVTVSFSEAATRSLIDDIRTALRRMAKAGQESSRLADLATKLEQELELG